jgi:SET family sugar efflux transporter-like MFS transporter
VLAPSRRSVFLKPAFIGLLSTNFVLGLPSALVVPFASMWATKQIGMSPGTLGLFMTINSVSAIVLSTLIARWSDSHVTRRTLLIAGSFAGALGNLGYALVQDPVWLTVIGSTLLASASINFAQLFAHVRDELGRPEHDGANVPLVMGVLRACYALAWTVGPLVGARIMGRFGYAGIFQSASLLLVVFSLFVLLFVAHRPHPPQAPTALGEARPRASWGLDRPVVVLNALAFALMFASLTLNTMNLPLLLTQKLGGAEAQVGLAFSVSPLFEMLFMVGFGHVAARGHIHAVIRAGMLAAIAYFVALGFVSAPGHVYPLQILNAAAVAVTTSVAIPFFQDLLPRQAGVSTSLYSNALKVGGLIGFMTFGLLASRVGNAGLPFVCAGLSATSLVIVVLARPRARRA